VRSVEFFFVSVTLQICFLTIFILTLYKEGFTITMTPNHPGSPGIWQQIDQLTQRFEELGLRGNLDYDKFFVYSIVTHSTAIEGSTLTEEEAELLFESGLTAKGKPLVHHLMNTDLKNAYTAAMEQARGELIFSPDLLKSFNAMVMKGTGGPNSVMGGDFDSSRGDFRLCGVSAGIGGRSYVAYRKIPEMTDGLCDRLNSQLNAVNQNSSRQELYGITFGAHLDLATIHPWVDGNGRTARLIMNLLQFRLKLIPTKTFSEDRADYIAALRESQDTNDASPFLAFMATQHKKTLETEIANAK